MARPKIMPIGWFTFGLILIFIFGFVAGLYVNLRTDQLYLRPLIVSLYGVAGGSVIWNIVEHYKRALMIGRPDTHSSTTSS